ncbi:hypothetical protein AtNW77_Chr3g0214531 [Arabidopsis thaliana]
MIHKITNMKYILSCLNRFTHQEALKREIERLRQVYHQQSLKKMENNVSDQSPADIKPSVEKEQLLNV